MTSELTDIQLDALRELANVASGTAATALSQMLGREVEINVPRALALAQADAVDACGPAEDEVAAVIVGVDGELPALVVLIIREEQTPALCGLLGVEAGTELGDSALREIGNILVTSYLTGIGAMIGMELYPDVPHLAHDMLAAIVASLLAETVGAEDTALLLDSELEIAGEAAGVSFLLLPKGGGVENLLAPLGLVKAA